MKIALISTISTNLQTYLPTSYNEKESSIRLYLLSLLPHIIFFLIQQIPNFIHPTTLSPFYHFGKVYNYCEGYLRKNQHLSKFSLVLPRLPDYPRLEFDFSRIASEALGFRVRSFINWCFTFQFTRGT